MLMFPLVVLMSQTNLPEEEPLFSQVEWKSTEAERGITPEGEIVLSDDPSAHVMEAEVGDFDFPDPTNKKKNLIVQSTAKRFVELLDDGATMGQAAKAIGTTVSALRSGSEMAAAIKKLISIGGVKAEIKKEAIRSGLFKMFMEGITSDDPAEKKLALEASKQMSLDPEIGLGKENEINVNINLGELDDTIAGITIPGIERPFKQEEQSHGEDK